MSKHVFNKQKWLKLTIFEQMGNIGSEVGRAIKAKKLGDQVSLNGAFYRGLDLIDATAEAWAIKKSPRVAEILRAREQFVELIISNKKDNALEDYFTQFAMVARLRQIS